jgi:hypothetical protein
VLFVIYKGTFGVGARSGSIEDVIYDAIVRK